MHYVLISINWCTIVSFIVTTSCLLSSEGLPVIRLMGDVTYCKYHQTPWRNGSASDSRSEGCVFKSRRGQNVYFSWQITRKKKQLIFVAWIIGNLAWFHILWYLLQIHWLSRHFATWLAGDFLHVMCFKMFGSDGIRTHASEETGA